MNDCSKIELNKSLFLKFVLCLFVVSCLNVYKNSLTLTCNVSFYKSNLNLHFWYLNPHLILRILFISIYDTFRRVVISLLVKKIFNIGNQEKSQVPLFAFTQKESVAVVAKLDSNSKEQFNCFEILFFKSNKGLECYQDFI